MPIGSVFFVYLLSKQAHFLTLKFFELFFISDLIVNKTMKKDRNEINFLVWWNQFGNDGK